MSEPIKVGDLVQIVDECCDPGTVRGKIGKVLEISSGLFECEECRWSTNRSQARLEGLALEADDAYESMGWVPLSWLKRIPPLSELGGDSLAELIREPLRKVLSNA